MAGKYNWQETCIAQAGGDQDAHLSPAADNNKEPILRVLRKHLPSTGRVLEVASGTGQHVSHFARALPGLEFQPTDLTPDLFPSIAAHCAGLHNVCRPVVLDATWPPGQWCDVLGTGPGSFDAVVVANMTHISPWEATEGLVTGAASLLKRVDSGGFLSIYGPFKLHGSFTTDSNFAFHTRLVASNPAWGYRDTDDVERLGQQHGLKLVALEAMPANNFVMIFKASE